MGAFDTAFAPKALTPADINEATLFTAGTDSPGGKDVQLTVDVSVIGVSSVSVQVGILPSGGSVHWKVHNDAVEASNPLIGLGPWFLQDGDAIRVKSGAAYDVTFSCTGTNSS